MLDILVSIVAGCALVAGFLIEWRRAGARDELFALQQRVALLEAAAGSAQQVAGRLAALESAFERLRRNL